ncbi:MAG: NB-ARC domain-containing protein [Phormidium sp.]
MCRLPATAAVDPGHETKRLLNGGRRQPKKKDLARKLLDLQTQIQTPPATSSPTPTASPNPAIYGPPPSRPHHNLPALEASRFIGYDRQLIQLLKLLGDSHPAHRLGIQGIGGIGKTTLVLEAAYRCLLQEQFEAIVFTCAQRQRLVGDRLLRRVKRDRHLGDILHTIARVLQYPHILATDFEVQVERIQDLLSHRRVLLIVDHLKAFEEQEELCSFLYELPSTVKAIITTREHRAFDVNITLESLSPSDANALITHHLQEKGLSLNPNEHQQLLDKTSGIPGAILYQIARLAAGYPLKIPVAIHQSDRLTHYYFEGAIMPLRGTEVHRLLMAAALFPQPMLAKALYQVASVNNSEGLAKLQRRFLLKQTPEERYQMLPLTQDYALRELQQNPEFEETARQRWLAWYQQVLETDRPQEARQSLTRSELEAEWETIVAVVDWCMGCDRYQEVIEFWRCLNTYHDDQSQTRDRLTDLISSLDWETWLMEQAQIRQDWSVLVEVMWQKGWKILQKGKPKQLNNAEELLQEAWKLRENCNSKITVNLILTIANLNIKKQAFAEALQWLDQGESIIQDHLKANYNSTHLNSDSPEISRYKAQILSSKGEINYKIENYSAAKQCFEKVLQIAQTLDLDQTEFLSKNWLIHIAIQEQDYEQAKSLVTEALEAAQKREDTYHIAFCLRAFAAVELARDNRSQAMALVNQALQQFQVLKMPVELQETQVFLDIIKSQKNITRMVSWTGE